jgi:hypothetical protein
MNKQETFEERKERVLREAREAGIVDISTLSLPEGSEISLETVERSTQLMKKNAPAVYERLKARWNAR